MKTRRELTVLFLHIPKTAGSTLREVLKRCYGNSMYSIDGGDVRRSKKKLLSIPVSRRAELRLIEGHMGFGWHEFLPQACTYITILREPIDRIISHYYYVLRTPEHYLHQTVTSQKMTLEDFVSSGITEETDNGQTRLLSGAEEPLQRPFAQGSIRFGECSVQILERAKQNLHAHFSVIGLVERFDETLMLLKQTFGWRIPFYIPENVTRHRPRKEEIPRETLELIKRHNELDISLYEYVTKIFEESLKQQPLAFSMELKAFQIVNKLYSWPSAAQVRVKAGFAAYATGDLTAARLNLLAAVCRNPFVLRNLGIVSVLLESWLGTDRMNKCRRWRHKHL